MCFYEWLVCCLFFFSLVGIEKTKQRAKVMPFCPVIISSLKFILFTFSEIREIAAAAATAAAAAASGKKCTVSGTLFSLINSYFLLHLN
jgi:hypothetical protein